jgi:hypothetical protein
MSMVGVPNPQLARDRAESEPVLVRTRVGPSSVASVRVFLSLFILFGCFMLIQTIINFFFFC